MHPYYALPGLAFPDKLNDFFKTVKPFIVGQDLSGIGADSCVSLISTVFDLEDDPVMTNHAFVQQLFAAWGDALESEEDVTAMAS